MNKKISFIKSGIYLVLLTAVAALFINNMTPSRDKAALLKSTDIHSSSATVSLIPAESSSPPDTELSSSSSSSDKGDATTAVQTSTSVCLPETPPLTSSSSAVPGSEQSGISPEILKPPVSSSAQPSSAVSSVHEPEPPQTHSTTLPPAHEPEIPPQKPAVSSVFSSSYNEPVSSSSEIAEDPPVSAPVVPSSTSEEVSVLQSTSSESSSEIFTDEFDFDKININTASAEELQQLEGIGKTRANAIIAYRKENGGFSSVNELLNVKGIGEKTFEKIRGEITV